MFSQVQAWVGLSYQNTQHSELFLLKDESNHMLFSGIENSIRAEKIKLYSPSYF
jgi:hypothetical protein